MVIILVGRMASGKTTLADEFTNHGFEKIVTYTTRPARFGENNGEDYKFLTEDEFKKLRSMQFFAETTSFVGREGIYYYGSAIDDYISNQEQNKVVVLNPQGVDTLKNHTRIDEFVDIFVVWLNPSEKTIVSRLNARGDDPEDIRLRFNKEQAMFEMLYEQNLYDLEIHDLFSPKDLVSYILMELREEA